MTPCCIVFKVLLFTTLESCYGSSLNGRTLLGSGKGLICSMMHVSFCKMDDFAELMPGRMGGQSRCVWSYRNFRQWRYLPTFIFRHHCRLTSLQECIQHWHGRAQVHALHFAPEILCIQINRFTCGDGVPGKNHIPFYVEDVIYLPKCHGNRLERRTTQTAYVFHACVIHLGARPDSGHYRAVFWDPDGQMWMCENRECAKPASVDDIALYQRNCYVFMYSKLEGA